MVFDLAGAVAQRHLLHKPQAASGTHRCLRQRLQRQSRALRLDQEKGPSTPIQRPPYHSALIPGIRFRVATGMSSAATKANKIAVPYEAAEPMGACEDRLRNEYSLDDHF